MDRNRPRGRERNVTGPGKTVEKHGPGLGTGPVGGAGGRDGQTGDGGNVTRGGGSNGRKTGVLKLIVLALVVLLGGGGGLTALLGGQSTSSGGQPPALSGAQPPQSAQAGGIDLAAVLGSLGGGSVSTGWQREANTGKLDGAVSPKARAKYTKPLGGGRDTVTLMVYMCGTDLESRNGMGTADLQEMLAASFGENVRLLVYTGGCKSWRNDAVSSTADQIWQVRGGKLVCLEKDLGSAPMTDPATLSRYIRWCAGNYPASRYGLILWDHGGGSVSGYGYDEKFASTGSMSLTGIDRALADGGVSFDFVGFDACLMATAETALTVARHADYLIASEETEPGVGWYYTDWLTDLGKDTSLPTIELGKKIADSFVDTCAKKCRGQLTTLSVVDLAELEATLPDALARFAASTTRLIRDKEYQTVSNARNGAREFASSSKIDQVDLIHLAHNMDTREGQSLIDALLGAVKYNRTSSNMTNAYGLSIYFPYRRQNNVDRAVATYEALGMDDSYSQCIRAFAGLQASGQAVSGGTASPLPALLGQLAGSAGGGDVSQLLTAFLGGGFGTVSGLDKGNTSFLSEEAMSREETVQYLTEHRFDPAALVWQTGPDGAPALYLEEDQWSLVQDLELNVFYDDGAGYIDLGLDNVFRFDEDSGALLGDGGDAWLAVEGQPVAYYHTATVDDGDSYTITGRVPVLHNGDRAELILVFDDEHPQGFVAGVQAVYTGGETDTVAKSQTGLRPGDTLEFLCDYYGYDGSYQDSYRLGEELTVGEAPLTVGDVPLEGVTRAAYRFTDLYGQHYWTEPVPSGD